MRVKMFQMNGDEFQKVTRTVCVSHRGPGKNMCAVSAITGVYFTRCFQRFFARRCKIQIRTSRGLQFVCSSTRTGPLAAHQPEPAFMEAERTGALPEDRARPPGIWDVALLSCTGMLIR